MSLLHIAILTLLLLVNFCIFFMLLCSHKDNRAEKRICKRVWGVIATELADVGDLNTGIQYMDLRSQKLYVRLNSLIDFL